MHHKIRWVSPTDRNRERVNIRARVSKLRRATEQEASVVIGKVFPRISEHWGQRVALQVLPHQVSFGVDDLGRRAGSPLAGPPCV